MIVAIVASLLFAGALASGHRAAYYFGSAPANFYRLILAALLLGVWSFGWGVGLGGAGVGYFFLSGLVGFGLGDVALYEALPRLGSRMATVFTLCLAAPFGVIIERLWLGTQLSWQQIVYVVAVLAGVALALSPHPSPEHPHREWRLGSVFGVLSGLGTALGAVFSRRGFQALAEAGQSIDGANAAFQRILAGVLVAGCFFWLVRWHRSRGHRGLREIRKTGASQQSRPRHAGWWIVGNAVCGPTLGVSCMQWALRTTPTGIVLAIVALTPLMVIPLARRLEGERPTGRSLVGSVIAVGGVVGLMLLKTG